MIADGKVYLSLLKYGQIDSDSVKRLQQALNAHPIKGGTELPITGNYFDSTDEMVRLCQIQHGYGNDPVRESYVGPKQAEHVFSGTGHTVINDTSIVWFVAPSLQKLFEEVNTLWPDRSKESDGSIGDFAHSQSKNEHNPVGHQYGPTNGTIGCVHAIDITSSGIDSMRVVREWLIGDDRVWYVIHNGSIWSRTYNWAEREYTGSNPHTSHIHVSLREETQDLAVKAENDVSPWKKRSELEVVQDKISALESKIDEINRHLTELNVLVSGLSASTNMLTSRVDTITDAIKEFGGSV